MDPLAILTMAVAAIAFTFFVILNPIPFIITAVILVSFAVVPMMAKRKDK